MKINSETKIGALIMINPDVIDAIVSINKHFEKLRNPLLRKILASRVTIGDAAKIGGTTVQVFFDKLLPLGFSCENPLAENSDAKIPIPKFYQTLNYKYIEVLDVRELISSGKDPFNKIMDVLAQMPEKYVLKLINTFDPTPLTNLLSKKGYASYSIQVETSLVYTYIKKETEIPHVEMKKGEESDSDEIQKIVNVFGDKILRMDVRNLEMPMPMLNILSALEDINDETLLYVVHDKVPVYLIEKLNEENYMYKFRKVSPNEVVLLIYKETIDGHQ